MTKRPDRLDRMDLVRLMNGPLNTFNQALGAGRRADTDTPEYVAAVRRGDAALEELEQEIRGWFARFPQEPDTLGELRGLVAEFTDPDPCELDRNGYCQAHGWYSERPCPHRRAKALLETKEDERCG